MLYVGALAVCVTLSAVGSSGAQGAAHDDLTPEEVEVLAALEATLVSQQRELDATLNALTQTTDPAARAALQSASDALQYDIAELTKLRDELQAPLPPIEPHLTPAAQAADALHQQLDHQERKVETIHDNRPAPSP